MTFNVTLNFYQLNQEQQTSIISAINDSKILHDLLTSVIDNCKLKSCLKYFKYFLSNKNLNSESIKKIWSYLKNHNIDSDDAEELLIHLLKHKNAPDNIAIDIYDLFISNSTDDIIYSEELIINILNSNAVTKDMISNIYDLYLLNAMKDTKYYNIAEKILNHPNTPLKIIVELSKINIPSIQDLAYKAFKRFYD